MNIINKHIMFCIHIKHNIVYNLVLYSSNTLIYYSCSRYRCYTGGVIVVDK